MGKMMFLLKDIWECKWFLFIKQSNIYIYIYINSRSDTKINDIDKSQKGYIEFIFLSLF